MQLHQVCSKTWINAVDSEGPIIIVALHIRKWLGDAYSLFPVGRSSMQGLLPMKPTGRLEWILLDI